MKTQSELIHSLESLVDHSTLFDVIQSLHLLCLEKAEHIETTWQDKVVARPWRKAASSLLSSSRSIADLGI